MIKKIIKWGVVVLTMTTIAVTMAIKVYAIDEEKMVNFASVASNNIAPGETTNVTLNLKNISYSSYTISIISDNNVSISNVTENDISNNEIPEETNSEANTKKVTISNVENLDSIMIALQISSEAKIGSKININIVITNTENENEKMTTQIELNVVEKQNIINNNVNNDSNKTINNTTTGLTPETQQLTLKSTSVMTASNNTQQQTSATTASTGMSKTTTETITYNGSDDNYLTNISINGEDISNFNKTNTTYFKTVESGTTSVDISYSQSDTNSTVCIYGNSDLKSGLNKILITVTAENGSTKSYRVYITVKA